MSTARVRAAEALLLLSIPLAAACSSGESEDRNLTKPEFQERANAICLKYGNQIEALGSPDSDAEIQQHLDRVRPIVRRKMTELNALAPPEEDEEEFDAMLADNAATLRSLEDFAAAALEQPPDEAAMEKAFNAANAIGNRADRRAARLGLDECVEGAQDD